MNNSKTKRPRRTHISSDTLNAVGIPKKFHNTTLDDYIAYDDDITEIKNFFVSYMSEFAENIDRNRGLFLYGSNGTGKTTLASIIAKEAYARRLSVRYCSFSEYKSQYTRSWGTHGVEEREIAEDDFNLNYKTVDFLVLEEIGKEIDSKIAEPILEDCLRYREEKGLLTVICTNLDMQQIKIIYGMSIASLIRGNMTPVEFAGKDRRLNTFENKVYTED
jgi:DNA replication protein DnaC